MVGVRCTMIAGAVELEGRGQLSEADVISVVEGLRSAASLATVRAFVRCGPETYGEVPTRPSAAIPSEISAPGGSR